MEPDAAVGGRDPVAALSRQDDDDAVDRARVELGAVAEDDDGRLDVVTERGEAAAKRSARARAPSPRTARRARWSRPRARRARRATSSIAAARANALEDGLEQQLLLRGAEARRRAGSEHDGGDHVLRLTA